METNKFFGLTIHSQEEYRWYKTSLLIFIFTIVYGMLSLFVQWENVKVQSALTSFLYLAGFMRHILVFLVVVSDSGFSQKKNLPKSNEYIWFNGVIAFIYLLLFAINVFLISLNYETNQNPQNGVK